MQLGCQEIDITPPLPVIMGGYRARKSPGNKIEQPLKGRAFVLSDGRTKVGIISAEIILFSREQAQKIKKRAADLTDLPKENIIVTATHTHSGPATRETIMQDKDWDNIYNVNIEKPDPDYISWLIKALAGALMAARNDLEDVKMGVISDKVYGVGQSRRKSADQVQNSLKIILFATKYDRFKAAFINYGCHPTVLGADNLSISPDFPGKAISILNTIFPETVFAFLNGAAGDVSTRFSRREQNHAETTRFGRIIAGKVMQLIGELEFKDLNNVKINIENFDFPVNFREFPPLEKLDSEIERLENKLAKLNADCKKSGEIRKAETALQGAEIQKIIADNINMLEKKAEIVIWDISDIVFVTIPGELFSVLGQKIQQNSVYENTVIISYSNGHLGYIPDQKSYKEGGYEALSTPLSKEFGEKLIKSVTTKINNLNI